jgi:P-type Cu+ transporter
VATDPVCGMYVDERSADLTFFRDNRTYYFCSSACRESFAAPQARLAELRRELLVAGALSALVLFLTYGPRVTDAAYGALVAAGIVQFYAGGTFYRGAWDAIRNRMGNMDVLIAVGTSAAFGYSAAALLLPRALPPDYYFDASSLIVAFILAGNYLEAITRERSSGALRALQQMLPARARVLRDGVESEIDTVELRPGDRYIARPGGRFPADGIVRSGATTADESLLTGEAMPVVKRPGSPILAASVNVDGSVTVETTGVGADTLLAQIGELLNEAEMSRVPLQRTADRIAGVFVPFVLGLAVVASLGWYFFGGAGGTVALLVFVSVAITACPCAFGIATPAAVIVGTGRAAEEGALFKGRDSLESAARVDTVLLDKTGTLTLGRPTLTHLAAAGGASELEMLRWAASVELPSEHPLGRAVVAAARERGLPVVPATGFRAVPGVGVEGSVDGHRIQVVVDPPSGGDRAAMEAAVTPALSRGPGGTTWSSVVCDGAVVGYLGFVDPIRPSAAAAIAALRSEGRRVVLVTGDNAGAARAVAEPLGIAEVHPSASPARKVEIVRALREEGRTVAFVGDGVNDAAALLAANVGIAIGAGTDVAREAGQIILVGSDPAAIPVALSIARATVRKVRQNLLWALGYNAVLLPIAAGALVPLWGFQVYNVLPITGGLAMGLSSTTVVLNSYSLRRAGRCPAPVPKHR